MTEEAYSNEHQRQAVEYLQSQTKYNAVRACGNSEIHLYLSEYSSVPFNVEQIRPYRVDYVSGLPEDSHFTTKVVLRGNWSEVER